ncbi:MAG: DNA mismatch repair endonuclease MutL [Acutalibacteraceae bacterium]|nr:DNA mismatch repair endonuclease MutL [Acutalibacteraceae bacterium]
MPKINLLPKEVAELIAAGEVVERPASVIKELVENSIDAGADNITVEINRGGIAYLRITDNGCGIELQDVPTAFLRHATSKIKENADLNAIATLGFRGEALAAISSVSKVEMFTKTRESELGTHYIIEGGEEKLYEEAGCPDGTTIIIRDIFYNTPARMKFLKKDVSEANAAAAVVDRIALSHPEIAFKFIRDGKQTLNTAGDGKTNGTVYSVLGREFAGTLIPVSGEHERITVSGLTCKPVSCRATRNYQFVFLNGRLVRSGTVTAAAEQAYKNSAMIGKFPGFVLYLTVPFDTVDVNVHPAKTEVRFSDERRIFDSVYSAVKNALTAGDTRPEVKFKEPAFNPFERIKTEEYRQQAIKEQTLAEKVYPNDFSLHNNRNVTTLKSPVRPAFMDSFSTVGEHGEKIEPVLPHKGEDLPTNTKVEFKSQPSIKSEVSVDINSVEEDEYPEIILIGEAFLTYIIVQMGDSVFMIDKHAAHERILFNELKAKQGVDVQPLLTPITAVLPREEYSVLIQNTEELTRIGFEIEDFGNSTVRILSVPSTLTASDGEALISELAESLIKNHSADVEKLDDLYHTVACKAAIKAGSKTSSLEMQKLAERVLYSDDILYCPHGRPVAFEIKRRELEKQFGRIQ